MIGIRLTIYETIRPDDIDIHCNACNSISMVLRISKIHFTTVLRLDLKECWNKLEVVVRRAVVAMAPPIGPASVDSDNSYLFFAMHVVIGI